jgi:hypothetical protein
MSLLTWMADDETKKKVRKWAIISVVLICTHALAYASGRYMVPEKVIERETVRVEKVEVEKQVVVVQEKIQIVKIKDTDKQQNIHREERIVEHPDGLKETQKTEDINVTTVIREKDVQYVDRDIVKEKETIKYQDREVIKEKIVENSKPNWRVGALVGYDVGRFDPSFTPGLVYGGVAERRIIGPVSVGLWGLSTGKYGTYGLTVNLEF